MHQMEITPDGNLHRRLLDVGVGWLNAPVCKGPLNLKYTCYIYMTKLKSTSTTNPQTIPEQHCYIMICFLLICRAGYRIKELLAPEGRVWKTASTIDWKERKMNASGEFVKKKMGRTWDFPLSLTTVADFYLCWQRGMWGSLYLAFNWLSICQHFTQFPVFKFPWRCGNIDSFQIVYSKASSPARPSSMLLSTPGL